jgi:hypothetical protein
MGLAAHGWESDSPNLAYTVKALQQFALLVPRLCGWALTLGALIGIWTRVVARFSSRGVSGEAAALVGLFLTAYLFHSLVPAGVEDRKIMLGFPALAIFGVIGMHDLASKAIASLRLGSALSVPVAATLSIAAASANFWVPQKPSYGFRDAAKVVAQSPVKTAALVSSERDGEGLLISEVAFLQPDPKQFVLRASKMFSEANWGGNISRPKIRSTEELESVLASVPVHYIVLDTRPGYWGPLRHHRLLLDLVSRSPEWRKAAQYGSVQHPVYLYERIGPVEPATKISIDMTSRIGRSISVP